jgi:hypothetical protein
MRNSAFGQEKASLVLAANVDLSFYAAAAHAWQRRPEEMPSPPKERRVRPCGNKVGRYLATLLALFGRLRNTVDRRHWIANHVNGLEHIVHWHE